ncbi:MAG: HugZ family protein [Hyphomicrobiaceae bacterium]
MPVDNHDFARDARHLIRKGLKAALATIDKNSGHPHASLVLVATETDGTPVLLISNLAVHTQNLAADPRASLLFDGTDGLGDPLAGGRVTVVGTAERIASPHVRQRFLARHPSAASYADFPDFSFFRLRPERAHFIGGFGRIVTLTAESLITDTAGAESLIAAEPGIVSHMNEDHADALALYATEFAGRPAGEWRCTAIDPAGIDLVLGADTARVDSPFPMLSGADARRALVAMVQEARQRAAARQAKA